MLFATQNTAGNRVRLWRGACAGWVVVAKSGGRWEEVGQGTSVKSYSARKKRAASVKVLAALWFGLEVWEGLLVAAARSVNLQVARVDGRRVIHAVSDLQQDIGSVRDA